MINKRTVNITVELPMERFFRVELGVQQSIQTLPCEVFKCVVHIPVDMPGAEFAKVVEAALMKELIEHDLRNRP